MSNRRSALGRGLGALISTPPRVAERETPLGVEPAASGRNEAAQASPLAPAGADAPPIPTSTPCRRHRATMPAR